MQEGRQAERRLAAHDRPGPAAVGSEVHRDDAREAYGGLAPFTDFAEAADSSLYVPLPHDWVLGLADVVDSTLAIAAGRYKTVNMLGAAVITAVTNAVPGMVFPFVFGGDGASVALPGACAGPLARALADTAAFARDELGLELRIGLVPVSAARAAGHDVRVARFAPSPHVAYAMFAGGGLAWAEGELKRGGHALAPSGPRARPDLSGLSCRFSAIAAKRGLVLSLIAVPGARPEGFQDLVREILGLADEDGREGHPLPTMAPMPDFLAPGLDLEARAQGGGVLARLSALFRPVTAAAIFRLRRRIGRFDPETYRRTLSANADFRKFDDGLRMTLDCSPERADAIEAVLAAARAAGTCRFGLHRQTSAQVTCIVPAATRMDHVHFVDGADGGYASASAALKRAEAEP